MKSPKRRRPLRREREVPPEALNLTELAAKARYVGSPEHKRGRSFAGHPKPRADASMCDQALADQQDEITNWLRAAIVRGDAADWKDEFPKYVWHEVDGQAYEARLVTAGLGEYKGYPLRPEERPDWL